MIKNDFYPDFGNPYIGSGNIVTDTTHVNVTTETFANMYYLGWIKPENIPQMFKMSRCEMRTTATDEIYTWSSIVPDNTNFNCGYLVKTQPSSGNSRNQQYSMLYYSNGSWKNGDSTDPEYNWAFPNKIDVQSEATCSTLLYWTAAIFDENGIYRDRWNWMASGGRLGTTFALSDLINFLYNDGSLQLTRTVTIERVSVTMHLTFKASDFDEDGTLYKKFDDYNQNVKLFLTGFNFRFAQNSYSYATCSPSFFIDIMCADGVERVATGNYTIGNVDQRNLGAGMIGDWHQGYIGELTKSELQAMISPLKSNAQPGEKPFSYNGSVFCYRRDNNVNYNFVAIYSPAEIAKQFALSIRISPSTGGQGIPQYGYIENVTYAPYITEDNEFTATLITGSLDDDTFKNKLRPWQYDVDEWAENDYTEDDLPPYNPGSDDTEESGDSVPIQRRILTGVSSFITSYGLTAAQVQNFGKKLWSSWADENGNLIMAMVENFKFLIDSGIASNTGSIDISSVLDFIISLKMFPCDVTNFFAFSNTGNDGKIYIGRGTYGLEVSSNPLYTAVNQIGYLDAGTVNVPKPFGDFRDYNNMNITVYVPYCGTLELNPADVVGRTLAGTYAVDIMTGECTFFLEVYAPTDTGLLNRYLVGTVDGVLGISIPVTATNSGQIAARRISDIDAFRQTITGFITNNAMISENIASQTAMLAATGMSEKSPEMYEAKQSNISMQGTHAYAQNALNYGNRLIGQFLNTMTRAAISAPMISGGSGIASFASPDSVYLQMRYGIYPNIDNYDHSVGKVSTRSTKLSDCSGWTICNNVDVSSLDCTEEEKTAIKQLLETGIFI